MTNIVIHLTATEIITSTIIYGIVHSIWSLVKWAGKRATSGIGSVIHEHVKSGHEDRFKYCYEGNCARPGTGTDLLLQATIEPDQLA